MIGEVAAAEDEVPAAGRAFAAGGQIAAGDAVECCFVDSGDGGVMQGGNGFEVGDGDAGVVLAGEIRCCKPDTETSATADEYNVDLNRFLQSWRRLALP
ncbi:hypothetical protein [Nocardia xishanensis]|uniref:Uncharacterized protein n=1 Tax=Nocardia xishanensis TaxID=238964 RepID=A0ABW7X731_9NOCA